MRTVRLKRKELLKIVKENRANHRAVFEKALEGYRKVAIKELRKMLEEAKKGLRIRREVRLVEPIDQTREYDKIIMMLEMSTDEIIELDERGFSQYVMDDWSWKANFLETTNPYTKGR
jgi:hypothetical protein